VLTARPNLKIVASLLTVTRCFVFTCLPGFQPQTQECQDLLQDYYTVEWPVMDNMWSNTTRSRWGYETRRSRLLWWMMQKIECPFGEKNCTEIVVDWTVGVVNGQGCVVHTDSWLKAQICAILEPNTNAQRLLCCHAGSRTDFWDKKSSDFSGEIFRERNFGSSITAATTLFPVIGCGVDSYIPELEHL